VAAHSWGIAWLVLALGPPGLDRGRMLAYAALHDLPEVRVGDLTPEDGVAPEEKSRREHAAAMALLAGNPDLLELWEDYEAQADAEARFVRQLDRVDMAIQALAYRAEADTRPFLDSADRFVTDPRLRPLIEAIKARF
jgi:putative hydrolase of HD superfamily